MLQYASVSAACTKWEVRLSRSTNYPATSRAGCNIHGFNPRPPSCTDYDIACFTATGRRPAKCQRTSLKGAADHSCAAHAGVRNIVCNGRVASENLAVRDRFMNMQYILAIIDLGIVVDIVEHNPALTPIVACRAGRTISRLAGWLLWHCVWWLRCTPGANGPGRNWKASQSDWSVTLSQKRAQPVSSKSRRY